MGLKNVILCDSKGAIYDGRGDLNDMSNPYKCEMARISNPHKEKGGLSDVIKGADVFIGLSVPGAVTKEMADPWQRIPYCCQWLTRYPK